MAYPLPSATTAGVYRGLSPVGPDAKTATYQGLSPDRIDRKDNTDNTDRKGAPVQLPIYNSPPANEQGIDVKDLKEVDDDDDEDKPFMPWTYKGKKYNFGLNELMKAPVRDTLTDYEIKRNQTINKYGPYMVVMVGCTKDAKTGKLLRPTLNGPNPNSGSLVGKLSPVEMAMNVPFSYELELMDYDLLKPYVTDPLRLPNLTATQKEELLPANGKILVSFMDSFDSLALRTSYMFVNNPVSSYVESLYAPYDIVKMRNLFEAQMKTLKTSYLKTARKIQSAIPVNEQYDSKAITNYFVGSVWSIYKEIVQKGDNLNLEEKLELYNKVVASSSRFKFVTPQPVDNSLDHYAYTILRDLMPEEYKESGQYCLLNPGLIEHSKDIIFDLYNRGLWKHKYFDYVRKMLIIESFRVANTIGAQKANSSGVEIDIPKDYFTIYTYDQMAKLGIWRYNAVFSGENLILLYKDKVDGKIVKTNKDYKKILDAFVGGVLDQLDYSKTCLTGSAISLIVLMAYDSRGAVPELISKYRAITTSPEVKDYKGRTLDIARELVLGPNKVPEAVAIFGADIDLSVLTEDTKEFDQIALKHFNVFNTKWPGLTMRKNDRSTGYTYSIISTNMEHYTKGFRIVEIYMGKIIKILSHHVPMVRGWYDGQLHLDVTAFGTYKFNRYDDHENRLVQFLSYDNYYYFASKKSSPSKVLTKYFDRGFRYMTSSSPDIVTRLFDKIVQAQKLSNTKDLRMRREIYGLNRDENEVQLNF